MLVVKSLLQLKMNKTVKQYSYRKIWVALQHLYPRIRWSDAWRKTSLSKATIGKHLNYFSFLQLNIIYLAEANNSKYREATGWKNANITDAFMNMTIGKSSIL